MFDTEVLFRGEKRSVEFDYEGDGVIVWAFENEDVCLGKDATKEEQDAVYQQLWEYLEGLWSSYED